MRLAVLIREKLGKYYQIFIYNLNEHGPVGCDRRIQKFSTY